MIDIHSFASEQSETQSEIIIYLHELISSYPGISTKTNYGLPFYYRKSWICYINPVKSGGVELAFTRGSELDDADRILEARGRKQIKGIVFCEITDIDEPTVLSIFEEALHLDETTAYNVRGKKL